MFIKHGASGGPVLDSQGRVFAVNSKGIDPVGDEPATSYVVAISEILDLSLQSYRVLCERYPLTMRELQKRQMLVGREFITSAN